MRLSSEKTLWIAAFHALCALPYLYQIHDVCHFATNNLKKKLDNVGLWSFICFYLFGSGLSWTLAHSFLCQILWPFISVYAWYRRHSFACEALEKGPALSATIRQLQHLTENIIFEKRSKKKRALLTHLETKREEVGVGWGRYFCPSWLWKGGVGQCLTWGEGGCPVSTPLLWSV